MSVDGRRVAMFVLNPCTSDARVRRQADALGRAGYDVRVFAIADRTHAAGLEQLDTFSIQRLGARSAVQRLLGMLWPLRSTSGLSSEGSAPRHASQHQSSARRDHGRRRLIHLLRQLALPLHRITVIIDFQRLSYREARKFRPDIAHAHDLNTLPAAAWLASSLAAKLVYDSHELWRHRNRHGELRPLGRVTDALVERLLIRRVDLVLTVSPSIARWLRDTYGLSVPVEVVRNMPAHRRVHGLNIRTELDVGEKRILLYTGRITSSRGLELAIAALPSLPHDLLLVLLGYGNPRYLAGLLNQGQQLRVQHRIHVLPPVHHEQLSAVASLADLALVAIEPSCLSYRYSLPNKLFEAVHAGLPVVASNLPDIAHLVRTHGLGETFEPNDLSALVTAVNQVLRDCELYRANIASVAGKLSWECEAVVFLEAYKRLVM